jgi:hypothetical protein
MLAEATFTGESDSGWQELALSSPVAISADTTYVASYYSPDGGYAYDTSYFTAAVDSSPLHALADAPGEPNGVYRYGVSGFPTDTFQASNYWVDVVFSPNQPAAPTITGFTPATGTVKQVVTITGTRFTGTTTVSFNSAAAQFRVDSDTQIRAQVPAGATTGPITVSTPGGTATSSTSFKVRPKITGFSPTSGPVGATVTIVGSGFTGATGVRFNGTSAVFTVVSSTRITATVPAGATNGRIGVLTPGGSVLSASSFTVT